MRITNFAMEKQMAALGWYCVLALILCLAVTDVYAASFDCRKAKTEIEKMICENAELSTFDEELDRKYRKALQLVSYKEQMRKQQREWVKQLRDACKDETCLEREYRDRIAALNSTLAAAALKRKPEDPRLERERIIAVAKKLKWEKPYDWKEGDKESLEKKQFCEALLAALQAGKEVEFVEPIVRTDDYNNPRLQAYMGRCPRLKPYKIVGFEPRVVDTLEALNVPEEEWEESGILSYTSLDFRIYQVDFDGNPQNGREYLLHGGGGYQYYGPFSASWNYYWILNLDACKEMGTAQVDETIMSETKRLTGQTNGVLRYGNRYLIYNSRSPNFEYRRLNIHQWDEGYGGNTGRVCRFINNPN